jgi:hypothetical protein
MVSVAQGQPWPENVKWKITEIKTSVALKCVILSPVMKSCASARFHPTQDINHPFVQHFYTVYTVLLSLSNRLSYQASYHDISELIFK